MSWTLLFLQALNGLQYGLLLFLLAAGLTLVLGIMNFVNLAHASFYMLGAYFGAAMVARTGQFLLSGVVALLGTLALGIIVERTTLLAFYRRTHLDQVLATFGLILIFDEGVRIIWGPQSMFMRPPRRLRRHHASVRCRLPVLPLPGDRHRPCGRRRALWRHPSHPRRHAGPRRRQ